MTFNSMEKVREHLEKLPSLSALKPEDYAVEKGIADTIASTVDKERQMKFTQIRKFFGQIKKIETKIKEKKPDDTFKAEELYLLMPELAYAYGRELITKDFYDVMKMCLNKIKEPTDFKRFVDLLTAVIAYSKKREVDKKRGVKDNVKQ